MFLLMTLCNDIQTLRYQKGAKELAACIEVIGNELEAKNHSTFTNV